MARAHANTPAAGCVASFVLLLSTAWRAGHVLLLVHNIIATGYKVKHATASSTNRFCGGHLEAVRPTAVRVVGTRRRYVVRVAVRHIGVAAFWPTLVVHAGSKVRLVLQDSAVISPPPKSHYAHSKICHWIKRWSAWEGYCPHHSPAALRRECGQHSPPAVSCPPGKEHRRDPAQTSPRRRP